VPTRKLSKSDYEGLAAFRHALRQFMAVSEANARGVGLTAQQHQALLSIKGGYAGREEISIGELAEHLLVRNHSAVELVDRLVKAELVTRTPSTEDRRRICLSITPKGEAILGRLSGANLAELRVSARVMGGFLSGLAELPGAGAGQAPPANGRGRKRS
jgi:DNA-binding MarR family transcriptional regulator